MLKKIYVVFDLLDPNQRATLVGQFVQAEASIKAVITRAAATDVWRLGGEECENVELILGLLIVGLDTRICSDNMIPNGRCHRALRRM
jgi:hypothetical protein